MPKELALQCLGLVTDPNKRTTTKGAMAVADNAVVDRTGTLGPRPGLRPTISAVAPFTLAYNIVPYGGDILQMCNSECVAERAAFNIPGLVNVVNNLRGFSTFQQRGNLYTTAEGGTLKLSSVAASPGWLASGMPQGLPPLLVPSTGGLFGKWFTNNFAVAYCICIRRTDSNGYVVRGAPSEPMRLRNTAGGAAFVQVSIPFEAIITGSVTTLRAGDVVEVYRSVQVDPTTTEPPDDMNLAQEHTLTSGEISSGTITLNDYLPENELLFGAALYTGPSQQGPAMENSVAPECSDIATYNHMAFYADITTLASFILQLYGQNGYAWNGGNQVGKHTGATVTTTIGLTTANVGGVQPYVGQAINDSGFPTTDGAGLFGDTIITSVTGVGPYVVTLSKAARGSVAGAPAALWDTVRVGGRDFFASDNFNLATREFTTNGAAAAVYLDLAPMQFAWLVNMDGTCRVSAQVLSFGLTDSGITQGAVQIEFIDRFIDATASDKTVTESVLGEPTIAVYTPQDVRYPGPAPDRMMATVQPGGIYVSKPYEPEAVPIAQLLNVGDPQQRVIRQVATRNAMWVFKADGLFRVSGAEFASLQVDLMDPSCTLIQSEAADVMDGVVYAWTTSGVQAVSDGGSQNVSVPLIGASLLEIEQYAGTTDRTTGCFLVADTLAKRIMLGIPQIVTEDTPDYLAGYTANAYIYSARTGAWTTWGVVARSACLDPVIGGFALSGLFPFVSGEGIDPERTYVLQRQETDVGLRADAQATVNVVAVVPQSNGTFVVTVTAAPTFWAITEGDAIIGSSGAYCTLTSADGTASFITDVSPGTGAAIIYQAFTTTAQWQPFDVGDFSPEKVYRETRYQFDAQSRLSLMTATYPPSSVTVSATMTKVATASGTVKRIGVPRNAARCQSFRPQLAITQALAEYLLNGVAAVWEPGGELATR